MIHRQPFIRNFNDYLTLVRANLTRVTSKLNSKTVPVLPSLDLFLIFPFHFLAFPVHPTGFSVCFFTGFLAIFILLSSHKFLSGGWRRVQTCPNG